MPLNGKISWGLPVELLPPLSQIFLSPDPEMEAPDSGCFLPRVPDLLGPQISTSPVCLFALLISYLPITESASESYHVCCCSKGYPRPKCEKDCATVVHVVLNYSRENL